MIQLNIALNLSPNMDSYMVVAGPNNSFFRYRTPGHMEREGKFLGEGRGGGGSTDCVFISELAGPAVACCRSEGVTQKASS